jgi:cell division protein FtsX
MQRAWRHGMIFSPFAGNARTQPGREIRMDHDPDAAAGQQHVSAIPAGPTPPPKNFPVSGPRRSSPRRRLLIAGVVLLVGVSLVGGAGVLLASGRLSSGPRARVAAAQTTAPVGSAEAASKDFGRIPRGDVLLDRFDASVFLVLGIDPARQEMIRRRVAALPVVEAFAYESPAQALEQLNAHYLPYLPDLSGATEQMLPGSFRVVLHDPSQFAVLFRELCPPGSDGRRPDCVEGVDTVTDQHWLAWITFAGPWLHTADAIVGLASGVDPDRRRAIRGELEALPVVERVDFESKAAARRRLEQTGVSNPATLDVLTFDSFRVRLRVPARFAELYGRLCSGRWSFTTAPVCKPGVRLVIANPRSVYYGLPR